MIKGLYTAASSMMTNRRNLDIISNNLANATTTGYKKDAGIKKSFPEILINRLQQGENKELGQLGPGVQLDLSYTDFQTGAVKATDNKLDLAIKGKGFFVVQTSEGKRYTRNGDFSLNQQGQIVTQTGNPVLNKNDVPLTVPEGQEIKIDGKGQLSVDNHVRGTLQIVDFNNKSLLTKQGENLYKKGQAREITAVDYQIKQGYLEQSNVKVVEEMAKMIETNRLYEANQKVIKTMDNTLGQAVNQVGKVR